MTDLTWTILVATLDRRTDRLRRLLDGLLPQTESYDGRVRVRALFNRGERPLADVRQDLVESATTDYLSFVDDDDELPDYHVAEVVRRLDDAIDYVGWRMQCYVDGVALKPTFHDLRYRRWYDDVAGYYRDVSHLNPVRVELARRCDFRRGRPPEDVSWADQLRPLVRTGAYVDRVMYYYRSSPTDSTWRHGTVRPTTTARPTVDHVNFSWHSSSST